MRIIDRLIKLQEELENTEVSFLGNMSNHELSEEEQNGRKHLKDWADGSASVLDKDVLQDIRNRRMLNKSRIADRELRIGKRKLRYTKSATPKVKRSKDVEP